VEAKVGGKIAQLGSRLIDSFARKMADQFFERFEVQVDGTGEGSDLNRPSAPGIERPRHEQWGHKTTGKGIGTMACLS
jgi:hypothetical protein